MQSGPESSRQSLVGRKKNLSKTEDVGKVMNAYYTDADEIIAAAQKNLAPAKIFQA